MTTAPQTPPPPKKGFSFRRVLLIVLLVLVLFGVYRGIRLSDRLAREKAAAVKASLVQDIRNAMGPVKSAIKASPELKEMLGEEITFEEAIPGELPPDADLTQRKNVPFVMNAKGNKALGMVRGALAQEGENWKVLSLEVVTGDGVKTPVAVSADAPQELQFDVGDGK